MGSALHDRVSAAQASQSLVDWEESSCPLCGGDCWQPLLEAPDRISGGSGLWFAVVRCDACGLCFTNPRPSPRAMPEFYPPNYHPYQPKRQRARLRSWLTGRDRSIEQEILQGAAPGRLLDFGCGSGAFLERMQAAGWAATGLDLSEEAVYHLRGRAGLTILTGTLPHPQLTPRSFDAITIRQVLEHIHDPLALLHEAQRLLAPGGKIVISTPNIASWPFRWFGVHWFGLDLPRHLTHFTPYTLRLMVERAGFRVTRVAGVAHSKWTRASAESACAHTAAPFWQRWLTAKPMARGAAWAAHWCNQSDCLVLAAESGHEL